MPYPYITEDEFEARVSPSVMRRGLDDQNIGAPDAAAVERIIKDASAKVAGYLRGIYPLDLVTASTPEEVKRLTLDVAVALLAQRHPEAVRRDWVPLMDQADRDLMNVRLGKTRLDVVGSPEPAANEGGTVVQGDPNNFDPNCWRPFSLWGTGDF